MENKLNNLFYFLNENRQYNHALQEKFYISTILPYNKTNEKVISLLYEIANTQSQPKIDRLAEFYKSVMNESNLNCLSSMKSFIENISPNSNINFKSLYSAIEKQKGWGPKTAALFAKTIYNIHNGHYDKKLRIWDDVPEVISNEDILYLPVDAVIIRIFNDKLDKSQNWNFKSINEKLNELYKGKDIEVWDDLWFWGFITQNGSGNDRKFEWNENKYWVLKESDKKEATIKEIKLKSEEFLEILDYLI